MKRIPKAEMTAPLALTAHVALATAPAVVLDGISFELPERGGLAVLGRNGVGKSTLLLTIMGYTRVGRGQILWRGERHHAAARRIAAHAPASAGWRRSARFSRP